MVAFLWTIIMIGIQWWAWPIIRHITKGPRKILGAISWSCATATQPGAAMYFAIKASRTHEERLVLFFDGMPSHGAKENETKMSWTMILFYLSCKIASMIPFILGLANRFIFCGESDSGDYASQHLAQMALQIWTFPAVPGAIIGLWLVLDVKLFRLTRSLSVTICYLFIMIGGILLLAACIVANKRAGNSFSGIILLPFFAYWAMCWWSAAKGDIIESSMVAFYSIMARNVPIAVNAFGVPYYPFPLPALETPAFGVWFIIMGVLCAGLGWYGFAMKDGPAKLLKKKQAEWIARCQERKEAGEGEALNVDLEEIPAVDKYQRVNTVEIREV